MKFSKFAAIAALLCGMAWACEKPAPEPEPEPEPSVETSLSVAVKSVETVSVDLEIKSKNLEKYAVIAVAAAEDSKAPAADLVFANGRPGSLDKSGVTSVSVSGLAPGTAYHIYTAAADAKDNLYEKVILTEAMTADVTDAVTITDVTMNSATVTVRMPEEVKAAGNVIKWAYASLAMYKYRAGFSDADILNGGDIHADMIISGDRTIIIDDEHSVQCDENGNPIYDEEEESYLMNYYAPVPGEPGVLLFGEFAYDEDGSHELNPFSIPGYYVPLFDYEKYYADMWGGGGIMPFSSRATRSSVNAVEDGSEYWTGFNRKYSIVFDQPGELDCEVDFKESLLANGGHVYVTPGDNVYGCCVMVLDDFSYEMVSETMLDGHDEYFQWFITSTLGYYNGAVFFQGPADIDISDFLYSVRPGDTCRILVTALGDEKGSSQKYFCHEVTIPEPSLPVPQIEARQIPAPEGYQETPYGLWYNVKCTTHDAADVRYASNYENEFMPVLNQFKDEEDPLASMLSAYYGNSFPAGDIEDINSDSGFNVYISYHPGMAVSFGVVAFNEEGVAGQSVLVKAKTAYESVSRVESPLFETLKGEWTATATAYCNTGTNWDTWEEIYENITMKSKITIGDVTCPDALSAEMVEYYKENTSFKTDEEVAALYSEFKACVGEFNDRTRAANRLLCQGFGFYYKKYEDSPDQYAFTSPYDLMTSYTYSSYNVEGPIFDFGPKWYLEIGEDGAVRAPFNVERILPAINFNNQTCYFGAYSREENYYLPYSYEEGRVGEYAYFPVEVSEDGNTITVKAYEFEGLKYYPNMLTYTGYNFYCSNPIVTEIVLTRGWTGEDSAPAAVRSSKGDPKAVKGLAGHQRSKTVMNMRKPAVKMAPKPLTREDIEASFEKAAKNPVRFW